jgi:hypothetical protein
MTAHDRDKHMAIIYGTTELVSVLNELRAEIDIAGFSGVHTHEGFSRVVRSGPSGVGIWIAR